MVDLAMFKTLITGLLIAGAALGLAPSAHADPDSYYLQCLTQNGLVITDTARAVAIGARIQHDQLNGVSSGVIMHNLQTYWGASPDVALITMRCASLTLDS